MEDDEILVASSHHEGVLSLVLDNSKKYNILSIAMLSQLASHIDAIRSNTSVGVVLISGAGGNFCAGADIMELKAARANAKYMREFVDRGANLFHAIRSLEIPVVCFIQGYCFAGGLELALSADIILCDESAVISDQHVKFGFAPGWGGATSLSEKVGSGRALDLILTAARLGATEAFQVGIVHKILGSEGFSEAIEYCGRLALNRSETNSIIKRMISVPVVDVWASSRSAERLLAIDYLLGDIVSAGIENFERALRSK